MEALLASTFPSRSPSSFFFCTFNQWRPTCISFSASPFFSPLRVSVGALVGNARHSSLLRSSAVSLNEDTVEVVETWEPHSRVKLTVKVPPKICKQSYDEALKQFSKNAKIPGFRPGKNIPESVLVGFFGKEKIKVTAIEALLKRTLPEAMSTVAGRALRDSEHILTGLDQLQASFSPINAISYDVAVDVVPEVRWTTENAYRNLKVIVEVDDEALAEAAAEAEFKSRYKDLGSLKIVQDRGIQFGDVVILDVCANRLKEDGTQGDQILSAEQKGFQLDTQDGSNFLPGFVDSIIGLERGKTCSFNVTFPNNWQDESLRGVNAQFTIECKEHFYRDLPDLDDSLAEKLHENCSTLNQVKENLLRKHQDLAEKAKKQATQSAIIQELEKVTMIDVPYSLLEEQGRQMYAAKLIELQASMKLSKDQLVSLSSEEMVKNYLLTQKDKITQVVKQTVAVAEIVKLENLKYSEEELNKEVQNAEDEFKQYNLEYDRKRVIEQAEELLEAAKVLEWLTDHSDITYITRKQDN